MNATLRRGTLMPLIQVKSEIEKGISGRSLIRINPSPGSQLASTLSRVHSYRSASIGSRLAAFRAG
jgi:hypothetical protein